MRSGKLSCCSWLICLLGTPLMASAQAIPAFPGAEGAGAMATGGRPVEKINYYPDPYNPVTEKRGIVYHVTTLESDPTGVIEGSLRYALKNENFWYRTHPAQLPDINYPDTYDVTPRIIVFDVGGTINLGEVDITPMNFTLAGQTAPGGITIYGGEFNPAHKDAWDEGVYYPDKTNNLVLRNVAFRPHDANEKDALWMATSNSIADHVSVAWYTDEGISVTDSARNVTIQHSIVGPGWVNPDGQGSQVEGKTPYADISFHHNLYVHNSGRIPRVGEKATSGAPGVELDFRNNVVYNWDANYAGYSTTSDGYNEPSFNNFVNNYYIGGYNNDNNDVIFNTGNNATRIYQSGNLLDRNFNANADGTDYGWTVFTGSELQQTVPYSVPHGVTQTPAEALATVQAYVGANWWDRNFLDDRTIAQLMTYGNSSLPASERGSILGAGDIDPDDVDAIVNAPMQTRPAGWDTDNDGMPDYWEVQHGLNPGSTTEDTDWNLDFDGDEYINVEEYINEVAEWPAPYEIVWSGGNSRYEQINNWSITQASPGEAATTTHWQPSKYDVAVINSGTVSLDSVGQHAGTLRLGSSPGDNATLNITSGWLKVEDEVVIGGDPGATAALNLSGGELTTPLITKGAGGSMSFTGGVLHAEEVDFDLVNDGGTLAPGTSTGATLIVGDYDQLSGSTLQIEITSLADFDIVGVTGTADLAGLVSVILDPAFTLGEDDSFQILVASTLIDSGIELAAGGDNDLFRLDVDTATGILTLLAASAGVAGDYNEDGVVDAADYTVWRDVLAAGGTYLPNDETPGTVDESDYTVWKANFGMTGGSGSGHGSQAVPEPTALVLALLGMLAFARRRTP
jgi:hypothetical protein